jgi:hypothetical protein
MLKAVLREGVIIPLEPVPQDWEEGASLDIAKTPEPPVNIDAWAKAMDRLCADSSAEDEETMRQAIEEHRSEAKAQMRRQMGLSA